MDPIGEPSEPADPPAVMGLGGTSDRVADHPELAETAAEILKAIAHPLRLRLVAVLVEGDAHVGALADRFGVNQPIVSQQLRILRMRGLVRAERENGRAVYRLSQPHLADMLGCVQSCLRSKPNGSS